MAVVKIIRMRYWCNVLLNTFSFFFLFAKRYVSRGRFESHPRSFNIFVRCLESRKHLIYLILIQNGRAAM